MSRMLYRWLVSMHPPAFRRRFAREMLWIYDESAGSAGVVSLWLDGLVSLLRQWVLRSGSWKVFAALGGAVLELTAGSFGWLLYGPAQINDHLTAAQFSGRWTGTLRLPDRVVPVELRLTRESSGWTGRLATPERSGAADGIRFGRRSIFFFLRSAAANSPVHAKLAATGSLVGTVETASPVGQGILELKRLDTINAAGLPLEIMNGMVRLILFAVGPVICMVIGLGLWFKNFTARRITTAG